MLGECLVSNDVLQTCTRDSRTICGVAGLHVLRSTLLFLLSASFSFYMSISEVRVEMDSEHGASAPTYEHDLASADDAAVLAKLGYKQELRRNFTMIEVFGIAFSSMGLVPSIASTLTYSIPAGPVGMVWGWFLASGLIFVVALAMADLGSAMPTSGGLYWWTHFFASPRTRNPLCKPSTSKEPNRLKRDCKFFPVISMT